MLDPRLFNDGNLTPTADKPLLILFRGHIPSLKNDRDIGITKEGRKFSRPKAEVTQAIAAIRDALDRQLPKDWQPIKSPKLIGMWAILGAHGVTSIPDADADNMLQTVQEALAAPRQKDKMTEARRLRLIAEDDKQFVGPHPFRRTFVDKDRIYHEVYIWLSEANNDPFKDQLEGYRVAELRKEALSGDN